MRAMRTTAKSRVAVLASGGGSNLQALLDHFDALGAHASGEVALVASDRAGAGALRRADARGVATTHLARPGDGAALLALLEERAIDIVVLAGYLKLVPQAVVRRFRGRMLNVHPALLPAFGGPGMYGLRVHEAVLDAGARVSGATVHFVSEEFDRGAIVAQWPVPVFEEDDPETLAARVLRVEHLLLPRVVELVAADLLVLDDDDRVRGAFLTGTPGEAFTLCTGDTLAADIDAALTR
jgi:phosphoribosylglycinamide formyltransferase-1